MNIIGTERDKTEKWRQAVLNIRRRSYRISAKLFNVHISHQHLIRLYAPNDKQIHWFKSHLCLNTCVALKKAVLEESQRLTNIVHYLFDLYIESFMTRVVIPVRMLATSDGFPHACLYQSEFKIWSVVIRTLSESTGTGTIFGSLTLLLSSAPRLMTHVKLLARYNSWIVKSRISTLGELQQLETMVSSLG